MQGFLLILAMTLAAHRSGVSSKQGSSATKTDATPTVPLASPADASAKETSPATAIDASVPSPPPLPKSETWIGHQVLKGKRKIPLHGEKETRTENFVVAEIDRSDGRIDMREKICAMDIAEIKGVKASMSAETIARLPRVHVVFREAPDGKLAAEPWSSSWESEDIDGDGNPGATVRISGSRCTGEVYVSNHSLATLLAGRTTPTGITGEMAVELTQKVLGASGLCLKLFAGDSDDHQVGIFAYKRAPAGTSCR